MFCLTLALLMGASPEAEAQVAELQEKVKALESSLAACRSMCPTTAAAEKPAPAEKQPAVVDGVDPGGFQATKWGMSAQEVGKAFPAAAGSLRDGMMGARTEIAGFPAFVVFDFTESKLSSVHVSFKQEHVNENEFVSDYEDIARLVEKKFGKGETREIWSGELYRNRPEKRGMAVSAGHLKLATKWLTPSTEVFVFCRGDNFKINLSIAYTALEFKAKARKAAADSRVKDL